MVMKLSGVVVAVFCFVVLVAGPAHGLPSDPSYDHQKATYNSTYLPHNNTQSATVTPFFSPDHSIDTETNLVQSATTLIRIAIPGWDSWIGCSYATNTSYGCPVATQRNNETFPIFAAVLNALHAGVTVQILTNNYNQTYTPDLIDPLGFLKLAGADVRYFTTVTFLHSKYISVDGKKAAVSSVNFSFTSFMENREAGLLIEDDDDILEYLEGVFDSDFAQALPWETITYSAADMAIIEDPSPLPVIIPAARVYNGSYVTPLTAITGYMDIEVMASPDFSYDAITSRLSTAEDVKVYMYQITDDMCYFMTNYSDTFSDILVSDSIYDEHDYEDATACYTRLYKDGFTIRKTEPKLYTYSHQKYWIVDLETVFLGTGNWGATDYPAGSDTFVPYGPGWRLINRDFSVAITNKDIVAIFLKTFEEDYKRGYDWYPKDY
jgi:phosphatidylserine/phosphatidylglycerophosphate/cardiolipin synthase-like enzyme